MRICLLWMLIVVVVAVPAFANTVLAPNLGSASSFGLLGSTISNTGTSLVYGDVGATTTITGFPPGTATGTVYPAPSNPIVTAAYNDFILAFNYGNTVTPTKAVDDLTANRTFLGNNVFSFLTTDVVSTANIILTFDAQADSNAVFIMRTDRDLTVNGPLTFSLINGALASNIYWIIGRTATISGGTPVIPVVLDGNILAGTSFTMSAGSGGSGDLAGIVNGCVFAETANTLAGQTIVGGCGATGEVPETVSSGEVPEPGSSGLVAFGCLVGAFGLRKLRSVRQAR